MTTPLMTPNNLKLLRLTSLDPEDYEVIDARGERVGRIKRTVAVRGGYAWNWTVYGIAVTNHPPAGQAPTRAAAKAAFKAAWAMCEPRERGA
jgi:hypothetical protein